MSERRAPPQLTFDDGSRIMREETEAVIVETPQSIRGSTPLETYYEIDRITKEIFAIVGAKADDSNHMLRVALQFPDALLIDSPDVCWLLEESISKQSKTIPLIFCLGDTTVGSCCPDEVAALHLEADVLVHYGHACLSPTGTLPVIYSFGMLEMHVPNAAQSIVTQQQKEEEPSLPQKFLLLYQVGYYHAMAEFQARISEPGNITVVAGQIPKPRFENSRIQQPKQAESCCGNNDNACSSHDTNTSTSAASENLKSCCGNNDNACSSHDTNTSTSAASENLQSKSAQPNPKTDGDDALPKQRRSLIVGGLELPASIESWDQVSDYTILFVGDSESTSERQYANIMLRFLSLPSPPQAYWTYSPKTQSLTTSLPPYLQRQLKRRFFLSQKARDAQVFGVLVSNLSQQHLIDVVKSLKRRIDDAEKSSYSFAVGKINPSKLANFAEIDCFVLVACREHSLLSDEREYHVPVITPLELEIALDNRRWGAQSYSLDCLDVLEYMPNNEKTDEDEEDEDAPYFSLVTGKYTQRSTSGATPMDLENLPGKGQVQAYKSEAADFLKKREYQGLTTMAGETDAKAAIQGQRGIASNYNGS
jgi:diphthamide biosynthesis protein 2